MYLVRAALPLLSSRQPNTSPCCQGVFSSSQKVLRKRDRSLAAPRRFAPHRLRAARYVGEKLSDKTTSPARRGEICWGRMKGEGREREREKQTERGREMSVEPRDSFPNLYVLTKTTYSLMLAKAFTISWRRRALDWICLPI